MLALTDNAGIPADWTIGSPAAQSILRVRGRLGTARPILRFILAFSVLLMNGWPVLQAPRFDVSAQPLSIELEELFRLGDDEEGVLFGNITQIACDHAGKLYVVDRQNPVVQVFSDAGEPISTFGGQGQGPGEFLSISDVAVSQNGLVYVWDFQLKRLSVFVEQQGGTFEFRSTIRLEEHNEQYPIRLVGAGTEGAVVVYGSPVGFCDQCGEDDASRFDNAMLINKDGLAVGDPLVTIRAREVVNVQKEGRVISSRALSFGKRPSITMGPSGRLYAGWPDAINIAVRSLSGEWHETISRNYEPLPIAREDLNLVLGRLSQEEREALRQAGMPRTWPVFQEFLVDGKDRIWMRASTAFGATAAEWLIFGSDGSDVDAIEFPVGLRLETIRGGKLVGVLNESGSGPVVVVYKVKE